MAMSPHQGSLAAAAQIAKALAHKPSPPRQPELSIDGTSSGMPQAAPSTALPSGAQPPEATPLVFKTPETAPPAEIASPVLSAARNAARKLISGVPFKLTSNPPAGQPAIHREAQPIGSVPLSAAMAAEFPLKPVPAPAINGFDDFDFTNDPPPEADFIALDFHCHHVNSKPRKPLEWQIRPAAVLPPALPIKAILGKIENLLPAKDTPYFAKQSKKPRNWRVMEMAAAIGSIAVFLGAGARFVGNFVNATPNVRQEVASSAYRSSAARAASRSGSPFAAIRRVISDRAALEVGDTFQAGMEAWGHVKSLAPGWTRNSAGWVEPGQLALFKPTMKFSDYRMEFYGQIQSRSMDWVVRGKDPKNYYAMKFTYIEEGLRPVIAMVHYPVINGKPGRRSTTPLDIMVHNHEAYHVGVAVSGNHIVTSIEGQEVDRWIEDAIPSGGVGFFADAGERARIYWMKVTKNEDFLGKVCALISGGSAASRDAAFLFSPQDFYRGMNPNYGTELFTTSGNRN